MRLPSSIASFVPFFVAAASAVLSVGVIGCSGGTSSSNNGSSSSSGGKADAGHDSGMLPIIILPPKDAGKDTGVDASLAEDAGHDAGMDVQAPPTDAELNTYPSFAPPAPQVVNEGMGPVIAHPIFVPVIFAGDPYEAGLISFLTALGPSMYWNAAVSEYGVGAGEMGTPIILNETMPASMTDGQIQTWLANRIGTDPRFGALPGTSVFDGGSFDAGGVDATAPLSDAASPLAKPPAGVIYTVYVPQGTTVTLPGEGASCKTFGGYHSSFTYSRNGNDVVYAVLPRCGNFDGFKQLNALTGPTSHELAEASTDPYPGTNAAYDRPDLNHFFWEVIVGGGEVGDLCAALPGAFYNPTEASLAPYIVQRIWSNKAAAAGNDPCQPTLSAAEEPYYFNSVPNLQQITGDDMGFNFATLGLSTPVGQPTNLELDLFSNKPTGGQVWQVQIFDAYAYLYGYTADLTFSPAMAYGTNGDKLNFTVTNADNDGNTDHIFLVVSTLGASQNYWFGVASN